LEKELMQAVVVKDGRLSWEDRPDPDCGETELLVEVKAAGINGADLLQRKGLYPAPPGSPVDIPGLELAGLVMAVGRKVSRHSVGDRVMAVVGGGGQATMAVIDEGSALAVPDGIGWEEAGGFPEAFSTAYDALFTQSGLGPGERVLVTGAAGGVGTAGVQLAAATGAEVIASCRHASLAGALTDLGADQVIDATDEGSVAEHGPYDVVLELIGAASLPSAVGALAPGGRIAVIGVGSGSRVKLDLLAVMGRRARITGSTLRSRSRYEKATVAAAVTAHVLRLLEAGKVRVPVSDTFAMAEADTAYERFERGGKLGKIVLVA